MKKCLLLQLRPEDEVADSELNALCTYGGLTPTEVERVRVEQVGVPDIAPSDYFAIIVGGSPFDITTPEPEKTAKQVAIEAGFNRLFDTVVAADMPFLGACSGNGLLGQYCGASISRQFGEAVGGVDCHITPAGRHDPLLRDLPSPFRALVGHKEACDDTPPGAILLASSATCPVQMFRVGQNVYATQFHPEGDTAGFTTRINHYKHNGYFPPETAADLIAAVARENTVHAQAILSRFVARYRPGRC